MRIIHFCVDLFIESGALVMTVVFVVMLFLLCGLTSQSTSMVMSVNITILFMGGLRPKWLTSTQYTSFRQ